MTREIPKIAYNENQNSDIEVMNFLGLLDKLKVSKDHNPYAVHKIEFFLIIIVTNNTYTHFVDFKSYKLSTGSAIFISINQVHHFTNELKDADGVCIVFNSLFTDERHFLSGNIKMNRLFNYHIESPVITQEEMGEDNFINISDQLYQEYILPNTFAKPEMLSNLLQVLFIKAERAKHVHSVSNVKAHWLETFTTFKNLLEVDFVNTRSSRIYASKLFVSYKFLNDIVKEFTGVTVKAFIDNFVTIEIKRYLVSTSLTVNEISYKTGFDEPANMIKFFKNNTQTTPLRFRNQK